MQIIENFREKANKDYKEVKEVFDKHGLKFFAFCGTALGAVRDNDFIPWDYDIDLASIYPFSDENKQKVIADLRARDFEIILRNPKPDGNLYFNRNIHGDLYWMKKVGNDYIYRIEDMTVHLKIPAKYFKAFTEYKLGDSTVLVPYHPELYLKATYDKDWRKPKKEQQGKFYFEERK